MRVNRYECGMTNAPTEYQSPTMHQDADGGYVAYEVYAALEQRLIESERYGRQTDITIDNLEMKLAQMAADNAELISSSECLLHEASEVYRAYNKTQLPDGDLVDEQCLQMVYDAINATPTTDAFLAEVRAQGVEMFASVLESRGRHQDYVEIANAYAAKIRKGVQS